jgi:MFS family permease
MVPGCGYLLGTFMGGRWADRTVKKWIRKRGVRVPEDRLRSATVAMGIVIPGCMLIYGWSIEKRKGGVPLPVVVMFLQGVAQLFCFPSLNTYCLDVNRERSSEIIGEFGSVAAFFEDDLLMRERSWELYDPLPFRCVGHCYCASGD